MERARVVRVRAQHPFQGLEDLRVSGCMLPSGFHRFHGRRFMSASANSVAASRSSGKRRATSRMASAYARSSSARWVVGVSACRFESASMVARSRSVAGPASTTACWMAAKAVRSRSASVGLL
jgi:hypothetical protein